MTKSKVYFTSFKTNVGTSILEKLEKLVKEAGIETIDFNKKYTAIKIHFGEPGNLAYLRPNYSKVIADIVKANGGKVFLTDANTLYVGGRKNAIDHLDSAYENGYNPFATGCQLIIADGLKGTDETLVPIDGNYVKEAKIGRAVMDADIIISMNHFKCHESTGTGAALKNIGMGCGSRAGKMEMHNSGKPAVDKDTCISCGACTKQCAHDAITFVDKKAVINTDKCVGCGRCIGVCPVDAIHTMWDEAKEVLNKKIAEYTHAVLKDRPHFHITFVMDVSPFCDCHGENDMPVIPNVGIFASFDPVALDVCCTDVANKQPIMPGSMLDTAMKAHREKSKCSCADEDCHCDYFDLLHPTSNWYAGVEHAIKLGVGTNEYEMITID